MERQDRPDSRNIVSPRVHRSQPYMDQRSPFNDQLRQDFYTGKYLDNFDKRKAPVDTRKDPNYDE